MDSSTKNMWLKKRIYILSFLTVSVLFLLCFTAMKLFAYSFRRPRIVHKVEESAFDMVMTYREGIKEEKRDAFLKGVNKYPHIFLRSAGTVAVPDKNLPERKSGGRKEK